MKKERNIDLAFPVVTHIPNIEFHDVLLRTTDM